MPNEITQKNKIGLKGFSAKVAQNARENSISENVTSKNRIALILDNSSSMLSQDDGKKSKIDYLKDAVQGFCNAVDSKDTSMCLYAIPVSKQTTVHMTNQIPLIIIGSLLLDASGGTPLGDSMKTVLENESLTRALIVSDGEADRSEKCFSIAKNYREADIPCDCVHIGASPLGEDTLRKIAEITGGLFIKFKDVNQFAKSIHYLTPRFTAMLGAATQEEVAKLMGVSVSEVKK